MTRDNYLAIDLLLHLGVRKNELLQARWCEFNFKEKLWEVPSNRCKTGNAIAIPIPDTIIPLFEELKQRSGDSEYVFPARKANTKKPYIDSGTINKAIAKLFGKNTKDKKSKPRPNLFAKTGIEYFTVHDLRRTCASRLAELNIDAMHIERCLNHTIGGVAGTYNRYAYLNERREALTILANKLNNCGQEQPNESVVQSVVLDNRGSETISLPAWVRMLKASNEGCSYTA